MFNSADDNTVACHCVTVSAVKEVAETVINKMLVWLKVNQMKVNNGAFEYIVFFQQQTHETISDKYVRLGGNEIMPSSCAKLLGVYFDHVHSHAMNWSLCAQIVR